MILYYTASQKTKIFAEALSDIKNSPAYELKSSLNDKKGLTFHLHTLYLAVTGKPYPVDNMPVVIPDEEIYLCAPVWGGNIAAPAWFFLNHADLKDRKVHLLLTCGSITAQEKYKRKALDALQLIPCTPGTVYVFATTKNLPEKDVITEQLLDMLPQSYD